MDPNKETASRADFERAIQALEAQLASAGTHLAIDSQARRTYNHEVQKMAESLRKDAASGKISWATAAEKANQARNAVMEIIRARSTPVGKAIASRMKAQGKTLNQIIASKTVTLFGKDARFSALSPAQQNTVYSAVVASAGKSNPGVTAAMAKIGHVGRGLLFVSLAISVYEIASAENKTTVAARELAVTGAGIGGSMAAGALAGLACGPGAPVCVTVGAFVGGALAAFGVGLIW